MQQRRSLGKVTMRSVRRWKTAAKTVDRLLYKKFPHVWTVTNARAIIAPWKGDLACL